MPESLETECAVLGAMLLEGEAAGLAIEALTAKDFVTRRHQDIFSAIEAVCMGEGQPDELTVRDHLERQNKLDEIGADYLHELASGVPSAANLEAYASQVKEASQRRTLRIIASDMLAAGKSDVREAVDGAMSSLCGLAADRADRGVVRIGDLLQENFKELTRRHEHPSKVWGLETGLQTFDYRTGGLHPGQFVVIGARRSIGKTALLLSWFSHMMRNDVACHLFSLEMPSAMILNRLLCMRSDLSFGALKSGYFGEQAWAKIVDANAELQPVPFFVDDTSAVSMAHLHARARQSKAQNDIKVVAVDPIGLMSKGHAKSNYEKFTTLAEQLKGLARELEIPVIALHHIRKVTSGEKAKLPQMDDLKESGALADYADVIVLLHRKGNNEIGYEDKTEFSLAKQRNGEIGVRTVMYLPRRMAFVDKAEGEEEQTGLG